MTDHIERTIAEAELRLREQEKSVVETKKLINQLLSFMGQPPRFVDVTPQDSAIPSLKGDEYLGKTQTVAVRMILDRRKALGQSPVNPTDIYDDLVAGGFKFETEDVPNRKRGLNGTLSRNTSMFHRLDNGKIGLVSWYPGMKKPKNGGDEATKQGEPDEEAKEAPAAKEKGKEERTEAAAPKEKPKRDSGAKGSGGVS